MDLGIAGKVALVTAGSRGLGRATALALAGEGVRVMVSGRDVDSLERVRADLGLIGVDATGTGRGSVGRGVGVGAERQSSDLRASGAGVPSSYAQCRVGSDLLHHLLHREASLTSAGPIQHGSGRVVGMDEDGGT